MTTTATTLWTASAFNSAFYFVAAVSAADKASAAAAFADFAAETAAQEAYLGAGAGDYHVAEPVAHIPDEDGEYSDDDVRHRPWAVGQALARPGEVVLLDSGVNG